MSANSLATRRTLLLAIVVLDDDFWSGRVRSGRVGLCRVVSEVYKLYDFPGCEQAVDVGDVCAVRGGRMGKCGRLAPLLTVAQTRDEAQIRAFVHSAFSI